MVIAHRGYHKQWPENTIAAFDAARAMGAGGIECDLRQTADGAVVVSHDDTCLLGNSKAVISQTPLDVIMRDRSPGSTRLLTIDELFEYIKQQSNTSFFLELKSPDHALASRVAEKIQQNNAWNRVQVIGFRDALPAALELRRQLDVFRVGYIMDSTDPPPLCHSLMLGWLDDLPGSRGRFQSVFSLPKLRHAKKNFEKQGYEVHAGVINDQDGLEFFTAAGFDCVFTDNVPLAVEYFK